MERERPPVGRAELDRWASAAADLTDAAVAGVLAGVDPVALARWESAGPDGSEFVDWAPPPSDPPAAAVPPGSRLSFQHDPEAGARHTPPPLRIALLGNVLPSEVVPRLLDCPAVGSVLLPVSRPPGALRRRAWAWPLRIGVADDDLVAAFEGMRGDEGVPPPLVRVQDVRSEPGIVDLLVLRTDPQASATMLLDSRQSANAVLCARPAGGTWPVLDARLALLRAATGAVAAALVEADDPALLARRVLRTLRFLAHAHPLDVALTGAFDRDILLTGELEALQSATLPELIRRRARQLRLDLEEVGRAMSAPPDEPAPLDSGAEPPSAGAEPPDSDSDSEHGPPPPPPPPPPAPPAVPDLRERTLESLDTLDSLPEGEFGHESAEGSGAAELEEQLEEELEAAAGAVARYLQAYVGPADAGGRDNVLRVGVNAVDVFIGPLERAALTGPAAPQSLLGFDDPGLTHVWLTAVLVPLAPRGEPVRAELEVPRVGRSGEVRLLWTLPEGTTSAQARLLVLHRNRVIQSALLGGRVGEPAEMTERLVLWEATGSLDDRRPFDRTIVLNHDDTGTPALVSHADGGTVVEAMAEVDATTERIRAYLLKATQLTAKGKAADEAARRILVDVAVEGNELYGILEAHLARFAEAKRIQIVTARTGRFLPLELVYDRPAPDEDARLCTTWASGGECGERCFEGPDDTSVVCPSVFWGMSRVIERQHTDLTDEPGTAFRLSATPNRRRRRLTVTHVALAASTKVRAADVTKTLTTFGGIPRVATWDAWTSALADTPTDLLVLMPHTDPKVKTLEISGVTLRSGRIERKHVTGPHEVSPIVLLFGCDTAGSKDDPAGYVPRFMAKGAAVVFSTLTMLLGRHAAAMSEQLGTLLQAQGRTPQPLGELVATFRREAVRGGQISALAVTAYGDADWKV